MSVGVRQPPEKPGKEPLERSKDNPTAPLELGLEEEPRIVPVPTSHRDKAS